MKQGRRGGKKAAIALEEKGKLSERAKKASAARWAQWLLDNPGKAAEAKERRRKRAAAAKKAKQ